MKMILVGPNAGKDIRLSGFAFKGGVCEIPPTADGAVRLLSGYYSAYPEGSKEFADAQAVWAKNPLNPTASAPAQPPADPPSMPPASAAPAAEADTAAAKGKKK